MKVLVAYPFKNEIRNQNQLIYLPELVQNEEELRAAIREHSPHVIIVGNNSVLAETLQLWRFIMGNLIKLTIIRRGTSLSRIDLIKSKELNINVLNTPSVNSRFVAEYMIEHLHLSNNGINSTIGIIGSGAIGSRIADRLQTAKHIVNIYSPSLTVSDKNILERIRRKKGIASPNINISMTPEEAVLNATHVIIAIDAEKVTTEEEKLSKEFFKSIPNGSRIVSVTEFRVFGEGALDIIIERIEKGEITARLDSHAFDLSTIKSHPNGLEPVSTAMKGPGCGEAMDQAALVVLADVALEQTLKSPLTFSINSSEKPEEITIIGAGITGLVTGFFLSENGYDVIIIDEHNRPQQINEFNQIEMSCRGTTLDGCDARHASITETLPHAQFYRKDSLKKCPSDNGGWRIITDQFNEREKVWIERFSELAGYPELIINLFHKFVSNLNRRGIELWEEIFKLYPQIAQNAIRNRRIIRICSSSNSLNIVSTFQNKYHKIEDNLQKLTHSQVLERIPGLVLNDGDAGGIEVPGFTINHIQLCANIIRFLENKQNVKFKWSTQIRSIENISSSKIIFASSLNQLDYPLLDNISLAIQGVLGCWTKLPNTHSIKNGFKITEKEPIGVINVTPSYDEQHLFITGGFAFCGHRGIVQSSHLNKLIELFYSTISSYLPDEFDASESESRPTKFCIRPMTPDGLPIITELINDNKKQQIYFIGGTSAGGFVQSTVLATLITDLFKGTTTDTNLCHVYRVLRLDRNTLLFNL
jgi:glycine/D-amino acid oxidase-like deaminating enzyme